MKLMTSSSGECQWTLLRCPARVFLSCLCARCIVPSFLLTSRPAFLRSSIGYISLSSVLLLHCVTAVFFIFGIPHRSAQFRALKNCSRHCRSFSSSNSKVTHVTRRDEVRRHAARAAVPPRLNLPVFRSCTNTLSRPRSRFLSESCRGGFLRAKYKKTRQIKSSSSIGTMQGAAQVQEKISRHFSWVYEAYGAFQPPPPMSATASHRSTWP